VLEIDKYVYCMIMHNAMLQCAVIQASGGINLTRTRSGETKFANLVSLQEGCFYFPREKGLTVRGFVTGLTRLYLEIQSDKSENFLPRPPVVVLIDWWWWWYAGAH
jgi:hypothetical protein